MLNSIPQIIILVFSIVVHEVAHGRVALWRGDTTARDMGRLTLNPIPHIDLFGTIIFPIFLILMRSPVLFGWAKPVPINPYQLKEAKKDMALVGGAGPASNLLLAILLAGLFRAAVAVTGSSNPLSQALFFGVFINLVLAFFNLIPVPPLDGSRIVSALLPDDLAIRYNRIERFGFIIIFLLLFLGFFELVLFPIVKIFLILLTETSPF